MLEYGAEREINKRIVGFFIFIKFKVSTKVFTFAKIKDTSLVKVFFIHQSRVQTVQR